MRKIANNLVPQLFENRGVTGMKNYTSSPTAYARTIRRVAISAIAVFLLGDTHVRSQCPITPSGLVAFYRAENNPQDSAGTNHGSLQGGASYLPGKIGQAFRFD